MCYSPIVPSLAFKTCLLKFIVFYIFWSIAKWRSGLVATQEVVTKAITFWWRVQLLKKNVSSEFICWFLFQSSLIQLAVILLLLLQMAKTAINNLFVLSLLVLVFIVLCFRIVVLFKFSPKAYNTTVLNQRPWETSKGVAKFFKIRQSMHWNKPRFVILSPIIQ